MSKNGSKMLQEMAVREHDGGKGDLITTGLVFKLAAGR